jgi:hypothetical protein
MQSEVRPDIYSDRGDYLMTYGWKTTTIYGHSFAVNRPRVRQGLSESAVLVYSPMRNNAFVGAIYVRVK